MELNGDLTRNQMRPTGRELVHSGVVMAKLLIQSDRPVHCTTALVRGRINKDCIHVIVRLAIVYTVEKSIKRLAVRRL